MQRQTFDLQHFRALVAVLLINRNQPSIESLLTYLRKFLISNDTNTKTIGDRLFALKRIFLNEVDSTYKINPNALACMIEDLRQGAPRLQELLSAKERNSLANSIVEFRSTVDLLQKFESSITSARMAKVRDAHIRLQKLLDTAEAMMSLPNTDDRLSNLSELQKERRSFYENNHYYLNPTDKEKLQALLVKIVGVYITHAHLSYKAGNLEKVSQILDEMALNNDFKWHRVADDFYEIMRAILANHKELPNSALPPQDKDNLLREIAIFNMKIFHLLMQYIENYSVEVRRTYLEKTLAIIAEIPKERRSEFIKNLQFLALYKAYEVQAVHRLSLSESRDESKFVSEISALLFAKLSQSSFCEKYQWNIEMLRVLWLRREARDHFHNMRESHLFSGSVYRYELKAAKDRLKEIEPYHTDDDKKLLEELKVEENDLPNKKFSFN